MTAHPLAAGFASVPDPALAPSIKWGILGPGWIAGTFARAISETRSQLVAVGSRNRTRAEQFASQYGIPTTHEGYASLVEDDQIDAIYVATPHSEHMEHALLAIEAGKHLLVEKAFTRNASEAQRVFDAAKASGTFVMEAMWTRFLPHVAALRSVIGSGMIGEVISVHADHGQAFAYDPKSRLFNPALAGGALLDLGVYPTSFAHDILGTPDTISAAGSLTQDGVDGQISIALTYGERAQASLATTLWAKTPTTAAISGTLGRIEVAGEFYAPSSFEVFLNDGAHWTYEVPVQGGFQYQIAEVARCVSEGRTQSERMPWDETLAVMRTMDEVRRQIGVVYPGE